MPHGEAEESPSLVILNTAGGLTGGDALSTDLSVHEHARATVTTVACERIYRSIAGDACIEQQLKVGHGARLDWIPQETILFDGGRLSRRSDVQLEQDAEITIVEAILFGRAAMGETVKRASLRDFLIIRRQGRVLFADAIRMVDPFDQMAGCPATLDGNLAAGTLVHIGQSLGSKRDALRAAFSGANQVMAGATILGDVLVARIVAPSGSALRSVLVPAMECIRDGRRLPTNWLC